MLDFPLDLRFKIVAISSQLAVRDSLGKLVCYVKQKAFKLKEDVTVFADESQSIPRFRIRADRVIDISAQYRIEEVGGRELGVVRRRGMRSLWRAQYEVHRGNQPVFVIREANPWAKVADGFLGEIPIVGIFAGYLLHPRYVVTRVDTGTEVLQVEKRPALFEGRFRIDSLGGLSDDDELLAVLSVLMMLLLERTRG